MSNIAIKVEELGKEYIIGHQKNGDLRYSLEGKFKRLFNRKTLKESFWALKDINFEINKGEAVGIIGRNGAGKSTLLKILSRITEPTRGRFEINGRVSSLLEVGTGFHMELTGRENIYLNGTILGMKRREIKAKFDEIVAFSGVEKFIDMPVKHYSSGMNVRLAFSVAAHLEPEILIIDEVLAVGDAEFQKKCLGKMDEVSRNQGRTVLFVSHNLGAVKQLCQKGILINVGKLASVDIVDHVIEQYITSHKPDTTTNTLINLDLRKGNGLFRVEKIRLLNDNSTAILLGQTGTPLIFELQLDKTINIEKGSFRIDLAIDSEYDSRIAWFSSDVVPHLMKNKFDKVRLRIPKFCFGAGTYFLTFFITWNGEIVDYIHKGFSFEIEEGDFFGTGKVIPRSQTFIYTDHELHFTN